jgi:hypothetical protein
MQVSRKLVLDAMLYRYQTATNIAYKMLDQSGNIYNQTPYEFQRFFRKVNKILKGMEKVGIITKYNGKINTRVKMYAIADPIDIVKWRITN